MKEKNKNLQNEQGSVQRQTQKNESYEGAEENLHSEEAKNPDKFGLIPATENKKSSADKDEQISSLEEKPNLEDIDDEKIIPGIKAKRTPWNSIDFEADNFFGGLVPA